MEIKQGNRLISHIFREDNVNKNVDILLSFRRRICSVNSLEAPLISTSNDFPEHMFLWRNHTIEPRYLELAYFELPLISK